MDRPADAEATHALALTDDLDADFLAILAGEMGRLRRIARVLVGDPHVADDLVGEAIARTLPRWRAGQVDDCGAYVRRVMANLSARRWRRLAVGRRHDHSAIDWLGAALDMPAVLAERDRTLRAVMRLPVRRRAVVLLRFYDDMTLSAIASTLGISDGTVKSQLSRALEQLRGDLEGQEEV
jgi:RNA polymerase sigma factor (sigma-70 family)